jgi:phosphate transport system substrate-binding protein
MTSFLTHNRTIMFAFGALAALAIVASCTRSGQASGEGVRTIDGAGATLPFPLYSKWSTEFTRVDSSVRVNYQPLGSGAGIRQMSDGVVDFGATDEPMTDEQLKKAPDGLVHVPMTIGAVVLTYNLPTVTTPIRLTPDVIADVFRGVISKWDDPRLKEANPSAALPSAAIGVVHRADGSGTSATFTTYLSRNSDAWKADVGASVTPRFPTGVGARGNDGVTAYVKTTPNAIGYVELAYAKQAGLPIALVRNRAGSYIPPSLEALDHAARSGLGRIPDDLRLSIVDSDDPAAYPITALSFLIVPRDGKNRAKQEALGRFVWWALHDGQKFAAALDYAPLPAEIVVRAEASVKSLRAEGKPLVIISLSSTGGAVQ